MAFGDCFGAASVNTYTTMELPAGSIRPVVVVKDMIQGTSDMFTGGNITVCAGKCMAASALKSISQVPSQINADTGQRLLQVVDAIIGSPAVLANGIDRVTAGNLIATVGGVSASRATPAGGRRTAGTFGSAAGTGLLRRSAVHAEGAHRAVQMANISLAAAKQMVVDESALYFEGTRTRHGCAP